jgi:hypothetical protein
MPQVRLALLVIIVIKADESPTLPAASGLLSADQDGMNFCIVSISSCKLIGF